MRNRLVMGLLASLMVMSACSSAGTTAASTTATADTDRSGGRAGGSGASGVGVSAIAAALQQFDECDGLLAWIRTEAAERVGPYGFGDGYGPVWIDDAGGIETTVAAVEESMDDGGGDALAASGSGESRADYSTTNVQEAGVDEPDLVKTDGELIYVLAENDLLIVSADPEGPEILDRVKFEGEEWPSDLLLGDGTLRVVVSRWIPVDELDEVGLGRMYLPEGAQMMGVVEYDVADDGTLSETARLEVTGSYVTARQVDGVVRLVMRHDPSMNLPFVYPSNPGAEDGALEANQDIVAQSDLEDWLPFYVLTTPDGETETGVLGDCSRVRAPQEFSGMSTLSVLTLGEDGLDSGNAMTLFGAADTVYASTDSLYAATYAFPDVMPLIEGDAAEPDRDPDFDTQIHRFDITDPEGAEYVASGSVHGHLLNQFAMSEADGHLRVASTEGSPWWCCDDGEPSKSSVTVLATDGDELVQTGIVEDLGIDESIFGVRFVGDRGYVVTFRQTDPLYVLDLSDPEAPKLEGELKITGYSSYLHPIGENLVLGIGQEATNRGRTTGTKVALFDVSDPASPTEVDKWVLDDSSSAVEWDHRAFLWWEPESLAIVPVESWGDDRVGAVAFEITDDGISETGTITMESAADTGINPDCTVYEPENLNEDSELWWVVQDGAKIVGCGDDESPASGPWYCDPIAGWGLPESQLEALGDIDPDETIEVCWPDYDPGRQINRSVVIGDTLWTVGNRAIQSNELDSLDPIATTWF